MYYIHGRALTFEILCPERVWGMEKVLESIRNQTLKPNALYVSLLEGAPVPDFLTASQDVTVLRHPVHRRIAGVALDLGAVISVQARQAQNTHTHTHTHNPCIAQRDAAAGST